MKSKPSLIFRLRYPAQFLCIVRTFFNWYIVQLRLRVLGVATLKFHRPIGHNLGI